MRNIYLIMMLFLTTTIAFAVEKNYQQMEQINKKISEIEKSLLSSKHKQDKLVNTLKETDLSMNQTNQNIGEINKKISQKKQNLTLLQKKAVELQANLAKQEHTLAMQLQSLYVFGKNSYLKMLLNEKNPHHLHRLLTYYKYVNKERTHQIETTVKSLKSIRENEDAITKETFALNKLSNAHQKNLIELEKQHLERKELLTAINRTIESKGQELNELLQNKNNLEKLIKRLSLEKEEKPTIQNTQHKSSKLATTTPSIPFTQTRASFSHMRGKLPWPTQGRLIYRYGQFVQNLNTRSNGMYIATNLNAEVKAIHNGKIIFANWLRGFGLLLIIDHNDGYMSLYAHNDSLYKKTGDVVLAGENIATSGQSGGAIQNGLYFEIRRHGKALNPSEWLGGYRS